MLKNLNSVLAAAFLLIFITSIIILTERVKDFRENISTRAIKDDVVDKTETNLAVFAPFIFLAQTEQCLRPQLIENLELSTSKKCRCDVIVLSYRKHCREEKTPHITYLFDNTTTWRTGRNRLFYHAMNRKPGFIYYIFMDDDVSLKFNEAATPEMKVYSPIHIFQNWLLDYGPAVGVVDYREATEGENVRKRKRGICGIFNDDSLCNPTIQYDMLFNAYHANAVGHIFPLQTRHEGVSWYMTGRYVHSIAELKFRGQALIFFPVTVDNALHRDYPRSLVGQIQAWQGYIDDIQRKAPAKYANHSLFEEFRKDPPLYVETSPTYCMNVTRHQSIVPFAHFSRE